MDVAEQLRARAEAVESLEALVEAVTSEKRSFTPEEEETRKALVADVETIDIRLQAKLDKDEQVKKAAEFRKAFNIADEGANNTGDGSVRVGNEPHTYDRGNGNSYFRDLFMVGCGEGWGVLGREDAFKRLRQHAKEVAVDAEAFQGSRSIDTTPRSAKESERYFIRQAIEAMNPRDAGREHAQNRDLSTAAGSGGKFLAAA